VRRGRGEVGAALTSRLPLPLDTESTRRRERVVAEISATVARGVYEVKAEDVADAILRFHRRNGGTGKGDRLAPRR